MRAFKWIPRGSDKLSMDIFFSSSQFRVKIKLQTHDYHTNDFLYHHHMQPIAFGRVTKLNKCQGVNLELFSQRLQEYWSSRVKWDLLCEGWSTSYAATPMVKRTSLSTLLSIYSVLFLNTSKFYHTLYSCIGAIEKVLCPLQICHTSILSICIYTKANFSAVTGQSIEKDFSPYKFVTPSPSANIWWLWHFQV